MEKITLKNPLNSYEPRLARLLELVHKLKACKPANLHLWRVMDSMAFQDTETALEVAFYNARPRKSGAAANEK